MSGKRLVIAAAVVALAQIAFLAWMIAGRAAILRNGHEVVLKIEPVDPRDLFRGDYVRLGYDIASVPMASVVNVPEGEWLSAERPVYVRLARGDDGFWHAKSASFDAPAPGLAAGEVDMLGTADSGQSLGKDSSLRLTYGIERFYVPEGEGRDIEQDIRVRSFGMKVAVADDGTAQVKALMDGDAMLYQEPLY
jgi:uncharacterized membrane-anchored protein